MSIFKWLIVIVLIAAGLYGLYWLFQQVSELMGFTSVKSK